MTRLFLLLFLAFVSLSCIDGGGQIIVSDTDITVSAVGEEVFITTSGAVDCSIYENGNFIEHLRLFGSGVDSQPVVYEGSWYTLSSDDRGRNLTIQFQPNPDSSPRQLKLSLLDGDVSARIYVEQSGANNQ